MKSVFIAYLLLFCFGALGIHKFYLDDIRMGIIYLLTGGIFGIGICIDIFTLAKEVRTYNDDLY